MQSYPGGAGPHLSAGGTQQHLGLFSSLQRLSHARLGTDTHCAQAAELERREQGLQLQLQQREEAREALSTVRTRLLPAPGQG